MQSFRLAGAFIWRDFCVSFLAFKIDGDQGKKKWSSGLNQSKKEAEGSQSGRFPASNQRCSLWIQKIRWPRYRARVFHAFIVMLSKNTCLYPFNFILLGIGRAEYVLGMIYLLVIWAKALLIKLLVKFGREEPRASLHATMVNLDFPDGTSPPSHILRSRKSQSPGKHASKPSPSSSSRIWNEEDELTVLKGLVDYQAQKGIEPKSNWADFYRFLGGGGSFITGKFSKEQVLSKIRKLKAKFIASMHKGNTSQSEAFLLSKSIWGLLNESHHSTKTAEEMANHEPSNNEVTEAHFEGNDESSWAVRDAFETMVSKGLSDYQKMLQLQKLMNLGSAKRKELSDEWNELCAEEVKLNIKRLKFSAMLAEAAKW